MIIITLARKPLAEASVAINVLAQGCGAINIDGTRVGQFVSTTPSGFDRYNARLQEQGYRPGAYTKGQDAAVAASHGKAGRWPANLLLGNQYADRGGASRFFKQFG